MFELHVTCFMFVSEGVLVIVNDVVVVELVSHDINMKKICHDKCTAINIFFVSNRSEFIC